MDDGTNRTGYEVEDAGIRQVVLTGAGILIGTVLVCLLMWGMFNALKSGEARAQTINPFANPSQLPPQPRLQVQPSDEREILQKHEDEMLRTYGWIDKDAGTVRLPIDRAMEVLAQRGLPARGGTNAPGR